MDLLAVQASAMAEEPVLAHLLAVIRGDDDQGVIEHAAALSSSISLPICESRYPMQSSYASLTRVASFSGTFCFGGFSQSCKRARSAGVSAQPELVLTALGQQIGRVGVKVIEKREERSALLLRGEPLQKIVVDLGGVLGPARRQGEDSRRRTRPAQYDERRVSVTETTRSSS